MKKILSILLISLLAFSATSCGNKDNNNVENSANEVQNESTSNEERIDRSIDSIAAKLNLGTGKDISYDTLGAIGGKEFKNGTVKIYHFKKDTDAYKKAEKNEIETLESDAFNEGFVLCFTKDKDKKLISAFKDLRFKN